MGKKIRCDMVDVDDLIYLVLSLVDLETLLVCSRVCKSWNAVIKSIAFRKLWCSSSGTRQPYLALAGFYRYPTHYCCWNPETTGYTKLPTPHNKPFPYTSVVASAGGLVCVRCQHKPAFDRREDESIAHLMVGNPVIGGWTVIPTFDWGNSVDMSTFWMVDHRLMVHDGGFRISIQLRGLHRDGHKCFVYDSVKNSWREAEMLRFSSEYVKARKGRLHENGWDLLPIEHPAQPELNAFYYDMALASFYDMNRETWSAGKLRSLKLTTGLELTTLVEFGCGPNGENSLRTCAVPCPGYSTSRQWECKGQVYFTSPWVYAGGWAEVSDGAVDGFGVWKVNREGGLELVSARLQQDIFEEAGFETYGFFGFCSGMFPVQTDADGDLVCFSSPYTKCIVTYSLTTGCWRALKPCDEFGFELCELNVVIYQPSLRPVH